MSPYPIIHAIKKALTPDLLKSGYTGHCYVASEAFYHLFGKEYGYKPCQMKHEGVSHWFLKQGASIVDITANQFATKPNYWSKAARGRGFLTKQPSKRAKILIEKVERILHETHESKRC